MGKSSCFLLKKKLKKTIFRKILDKHGNEIYYNALDTFMSEKKVIYNIIINCVSMPIDKYKSKSQIITYYIELFLKEYPKHSNYRSDIYEIFQKCFEEIFGVLNSMSTDENVRKICNFLKELIGELSYKMEEKTDILLDEYKKTNANFDQSETKSNGSDKISYKQYFEYLERLYIKNKG